MKFHEGLTGAELYEYLNNLQSTLQKRGFPDLVEKIAHVRKFGSGSSSEFFHEVEVLFHNSTEQFVKALEEDEVRLMNIVLARINAAFRRIGGA